MLKLGVTGRIGSGKSIVCQIFSTLGIPVYKADERAKELVNSNSELQKVIISEFGNESFVNSVYNRPYIASVVFKDQKKLSALNRIIHPVVEKDYSIWLADKKKFHYTVYEAAILFESGASEKMDYILVIDAPENELINRVMKRDNLSRAEVELRLNNQWKTDKKDGLADWIIMNDGNTLILPKVLEIHKYLMQLMN